MENYTDSKKIIINYGLILAGTSILVGLMQYATGTHLERNWFSSIIGVALVITLTVLGIKKFKKMNNGFLSWGQAVKVGVGIAVIAGLIGAIYQYVFINFIEPDFMDLVAEKQEEILLEQGYTDEQIEAAQEMGKKFQSPLIMSSMSIIGSAIFGFVISAIAGAAMKKSAEDNY